MTITQKRFASESYGLGGPILIAVALEVLGVVALAFPMAYKQPPVVAQKIVHIHMVLSKPQPVAPPKIPTVLQPSLPKVTPAPVTPLVHTVSHPRIIHHIAPPHVVQHMVLPVPPQPVKTTPAPAAPPVSKAQVQSLMARYVEEIRARVDANLQVPPQLASLGLGGTCILEFTLAPDGSLLSSRILTSSGLALVDHAALAALRSSHFMQFLPGMGTVAHTFTMPVQVLGNGGD